MLFTYQCYTSAEGPGPTANVIISKVGLKSWKRRKNSMMAAAIQVLLNTAWSGYFLLVIIYMSSVLQLAPNTHHDIKN